MNTEFTLFRSRKLASQLKITALLLTLALIISFLPMTVLADGPALPAPIIQTILKTGDKTLAITVDKDINAATLPLAADLGDAFKVKQGDVSLGIAGCALGASAKVIVVTTVIAFTGDSNITIRYDADDGGIRATDGSRLRSFKLAVPYSRAASAPRITTQPKNIKVKVGQAASLSIVVAPVTAPETIAYQWYSYPSLSNKDGLKVFTRVGTLIPGATAATYVPPTATAGKTYYYCMVSHNDPNAPGEKTTTTRSHAAKVIVFTQMNAETPKITKQPTSLKVNLGAVASLTVAAAPVSPPGTLSYQWYSYVPENNRGESKNGKYRGTAIAAPAGTAATFTVPTATAGITYYYCVVTNTDTTVPGKQKVSIKSAIAKVTVIDPAATIAASGNSTTSRKTRTTQDRDDRD